MSVFWRKFWKSGWYPAGTGVTHAGSNANEQFSLAPSRL